MHFTMGLSEDRVPQILMAYLSWFIIILPPLNGHVPLYPDKATCGTGGYLEARADFWGTSRGQGGSVDMDYTPFLNIWCQHVSSN